MQYPYVMRIGGRSALGPAQTWFLSGLLLVLLLVPVSAAQDAQVTAGDAVADPEKADPATDPAEDPAEEPSEEEVEVVKARMVSAPGHRDIRSLRRLVPGGGRVDWSQQGDAIAFDQASEEGLYDVYTMRPDGTDLHCLSCDNWDFRGVHVLSPTWHPGGEHLVVQVQESARRLELGKAELVTPDRGLHSELWVFSRDGRDYWQLTQLKERGRAVLDPLFSHEAGRLAWSERLEARQGRWGAWGMRIVELEMGRGVPHLGRSQRLEAAGHRGLVVAQGFTPDDRSLLVAATTGVGTVELLTIDIASQTVTPLVDGATTLGGPARYAPHGDLLVWATDRGVREPPRRLPWRSDLWLRSQDGGCQERLTFFNEPRAETFLEEALIGDIAWSPRGDELLLHVVSAGPEVEEAVYLLTLDASYRR